MLSDIYIANSGSYNCCFKVTHFRTDRYIGLNSPAIILMHEKAIYDES
jgi:hypothetical protein